MPLNVEKKVAGRPDTGSEQGKREPGTGHRVPAIKPRDSKESGKPAEDPQEKRSKRADVGEAAEQGGSGERSDPESRP